MRGHALKHDMSAGDSCSTLTIQGNPKPDRTQKKNNKILIYNVNILLSTLVINPVISCMGPSIVYILHVCMRAVGYKKMHIHCMDPVIA